MLAQIYNVVKAFSKYALSYLGTRNQALGIETSVYRIVMK